jgi:hypothetical protein
LLTGFTTFSSYGLQTFTLLRDGEFGLAILNVIGRIFLVYQLCGLATFWAEFCEGNYDDPEKEFPSRLFVGERTRNGGRYCASRRDGFGKHSVLHTAKILRLSEDVPMVVDIVDSREKVEGFCRSWTE